MPRLKPPPGQQAEIALQDPTPPSDPIEIELSDDLGVGDTHIDLAPPTPVVPTPAPAPTPAPESTLATQLAAQQRSEELQRQNNELVRRDQERNAELLRERSRGDDAEYNSVLTAIAAEQATLDKAEADYAGFLQAGDAVSASKVMRVLTGASARLDRLEDGKLAFDNKREALKTAPPAPQQVERTAPLDTEQKIAAIPGLPENAKGWLRKHPEFVNDTAMNKRLGSVHNYLTDNKGVQAFSEAYFEALDTEFGLKAAAPLVPEPQPQRRSMPLSAPVSRDVPTPSGQRQEPSKVTLSPEERLIARTSFGLINGVEMSNEQKEKLYAQNKMKLRRMRANGEYRQTTEQNG